MNVISVHVGQPCVVNLVLRCVTAALLARCATGKNVEYIRNTSVAQIDYITQHTAQTSAVK